MNPNPTAQMSDVPELEVLALAAHSDDVEQTCGGTLLDLAARGVRTGIVDLTAGEAGTRGGAAERQAEAQRAAQLLKVQWRGNLGMPDGALAITPENKLRIAEVIRRARPRILILPWPYGRHPDHYTAGKLGYEAAFTAGLGRITVPESKTQAYRPRTVVYASLYANERPTFVVDITAHFETRVQSLLAYSSQYKNQQAGKEIFPDEGDIVHRLEALARTYGMMIGVKYGEPFISPTPIKVSDLRALEIDTFTRGGLITPF